jgi:hypothetical protein
VFFVALAEKNVSKGGLIYSKKGYHEKKIITFSFIALLVVDRFITA